MRAKSERTLISKKQTSAYIYENMQLMRRRGDSTLLSNTKDKRGPQNIGQWKKCKNTKNV